MCCTPTCPRMPLPVPESRNGSAQERGREEPDEGWSTQQMGGAREITMPRQMRYRTGGAGRAGRGKVRAARLHCRAHHVVLLRYVEHASAYPRLDLPPLLCRHWVNDLHRHCALLGRDVGHRHPPHLLRARLRPSRAAHGRDARPDGVRLDVALAPKGPARKGGGWTCSQSPHQRRHCHQSTPHEVFV